MNKEMCSGLFIHKAYIDNDLINIISLPSNFYHSMLVEVTKLTQSFICQIYSCHFYVINQNIFKVTETRQYSSGVENVRCGAMAAMHITTGKTIACKGGPKAKQQHLGGNRWGQWFGMSQDLVLVACRSHWLVYAHHMVVSILIGALWLFKSLSLYSLSKSWSNNL